MDRHLHPYPLQHAPLEGHRPGPKAEVPGRFGGVLIRAWRAHGVNGPQGDTHSKEKQTLRNFYRKCTKL